MDDFVGVRYCVLPKSVKKQRILENSKVADIELSEAEMEELDSLDEGLCTGVFKMSPF